MPTPGFLCPWCPAVMWSGWKSRESGDRSLSAGLWPTAPQGWGKGRRDTRINDSLYQWVYPNKEELLHWNNKHNLLQKWLVGKTVFDTEVCFQTLHYRCLVENQHVERLTFVGDLLQECSYREKACFQNQSMFGHLSHITIQRTMQGLLNCMYILKCSVKFRSLHFVRLSEK